MKQKYTYSQILKSYEWCTIKGKYYIRGGTREELLNYQHCLLKTLKYYANLEREQKKKKRSNNGTL